MDDRSNPLIYGLYASLQLSAHAEAQCYAEEVWVQHKGVTDEDDERRCPGDHDILGTVGISTTLPCFPSICTVQGNYSFISEFYGGV